MVQIVLAEVVLGQVGDVGKLHVRNILRAKKTNIHDCKSDVLDYLFSFLLVPVAVAKGVCMVDPRGFDCCVQIVLLWAYFGVGTC